MRIFTGGLMLVLAGCMAEPGGSVIKPGDALPSFIVTLSDGTELNSATVAGEGGVICFFNTACGDCRLHLPRLQARYESGERIWCISREEDAGSVDAYWQANGLTMPWSAQEGREVYSLFAHSGIPRQYTVAPGGTVTAVD
ncbi:MAG: peroxiredoxin family protein [Muribaculaceae bacterium]|nr:peroxiredoxin family protein [Muribaculaceae bacterium]